MRRDWVSVRDLGIKYGKGAERVVRTERESENKVTDLKHMTRSEKYITQKREEWHKSRRYS